MFNFCFLLDKENDWIFPFVRSFLEDSGLDPSQNIIFDSKNIGDFEICFVLGFTKIISREDLSRDCKYFIVHESSLPKGKGFAPLMWQILEGEKKY